MKHLLIVLSIKLFSGILSAQNLNFEWAKRVGGTDWDEASSINTDSNGNVYLTGFFHGTADFDPGVGVNNLTSYNSFNRDIFITKLDSDGNFVWAKRIGNGSEETSFSIQIDANEDVIVTGLFSGTVDFNPDSGVYDLTSSGSNQDVFILKLDSGGNFVWAKRIGGEGTVNGRSALDQQGNVYTYGGFSDTVDFDPNAGVNTVYSSGAAFIQKLDANGDFMWVKTFGGVTGGSIVDLKFDSSGNIHSIGVFWDQMDFDPGPGTFELTSNGIMDIFIQKLDSGGNFLWVKQLGGASLDFPRGISLDELGNVYTTGAFLDTVDFDTGTGVYNLSAFNGADPFIHKLDQNGNFIWAKQIDVSEYGDVGDIQVTSAGQVLTYGNFKGEAYFDPNTGGDHRVSEGEYDLFLHVLTTNGNYVGTEQIGGVNWESFNEMSIDPFGNVIISGSFVGTVDFDPSPNVTELTAANNYDAFAVKLDNSLVGINEAEEDIYFDVYPNPSNGDFQIRLSELGTFEVKIYDIQHKIIYSSQHPNTNTISLSLDKPKGVYFVEITGDFGKKMKVFVKQ